MQGIIVQNLSGLYQVLSEDGAVFRCRARGIFRKDKITLSAGDSVEIDPLGGNEGIITFQHPRRNEFIRPNVANVDMICYIISARFPEPDPFLIDKMTVLAKLKGVEIVLILNKTDLDDDFSAHNTLQLYSSLGYRVLECSAINMTIAQQILDLTSGKVAVLTGNTGVGKSSILNALELGVNAKVSEISEKLGRGRHTTREVTFYQRNDGGLLADSPGFGNIDISLESALTTENLSECFSEFLPWISQCQFVDCTHTCERGCILRDKVESGEISESRYNSYLLMYNALKERDEVNYNRSNHK